MEKKNKKILIHSCSFELGGAERQATNFAIYLKEKGYDVSVASFGREGALIDTLKTFGIPFFILKSDNKFLFFISRVIEKISVKIFRKDNFDRNIMVQIFVFLIFLYRYRFKIILSYCNEANTIAGLAKSFYMIKSIFAWYQRDAIKTGWNLRLIKKAILNVDIVLSNSMSCHVFLKDNYGIESTVIRNGVKLKPVQFSKNEWYEKLHVDNSYFLATMIANLHHNKDHMTLLKAWNVFSQKKDVKKIKLLLAGYFSDRYDTLKEFVDKNSLTDSVVFLGQIQDISGLLNISTISVFSSLSEGSPNGVIESCLASKAVVATDLLEIRDVLSQENVSLLHNMTDITRFAENIYKLYNNNELARRVGEANKKKAEEMFSFEGNFSKLTRVIYS